MVIFLFLLLSVLFLIFCHLFFNFLLRLFYCNKLLLPPFVVLLFFHHILLRDEELGWMDDGTDGWKGRSPLDRCLEANVTPPNYTYRVKPPPTHTTQGRGPDGQTPRILYTTTSGCCFTLATSFSPFSMLHFPTLESHASEGMACAYMCVCVRVCMYNIIHGEVRTL